MNRTGTRECNYLNREIRYTGETVEKGVPALDESGVENGSIIIYELQEKEFHGVMLVEFALCAPTLDLREPTRERGVDEVEDRDETNVEDGRANHHCNRWAGHLERVEKDRKGGAKQEERDHNHNGEHYQHENPAVHEDVNRRTEKPEA